MSEIAVAAIDVSGSTACFPDYFVKVKQVLDDLNLPVEVILWSDKAHHYPNYKKLDLKTVISNGGTEPEVFVGLLKDYESFHLYIFTDGMISDLSVDKCKTTLEAHKILRKLINIKLYYIGKEEDMNLKMTDIFTGIPQEIFINDVVNSIGMMDPNLDFSSVDYEFVMSSETLKATVLSKLNSKNVDKVALKKEIQKLTNRILKSISDESVIEMFFTEDKVSDCVDFIQKNYKFSNSKVEFQRKMSDILNLFDKNIDTYSLNVFKRLEPTVLEYEEPGEEFEDVTCDILYENCKTVCFPIKKITKRKTQFLDGEKKMTQNPFKLLQSTKMISKIVKLVEPYILDYETFKKIQNNKISPFTRDVLQGVYVLHNENIDAYKLVQNNSYALSVLFGGKLPGNKILWNIVFLYAMAKHHQFSKYKELLFEEIKFLGDHFRYFITLTPFMNPPYYEKFNVCFWYIAKVSHLLYPNSKKNLLRSMDTAQVFLEFYNDVYGKVDKPDEMNVWQLWKYFLLNKSNPFFIFYILAHHYNFKMYKNGAIVLFQGEQTQKLENVMEYVMETDVSTILSLFKKLWSNSKLTPYDDLSKELLNANLQLLTAKEQCLSLPGCDVNVDCSLDHVSINMETCHPFVICRVTRKHWRECAGNYDKRKESYLRLFRRYCMEKETYPEDVGDLIVYLNHTLFKRSKKPEIFHEIIENHMFKILTIFKSVMETYTCKEYVEKAKKYYQSEALRLTMEK